MKVKLIPERCIACGLCQTYSSLFDYDDDGIVVFSDDSQFEKTIEPNPDILKAIKSCPTKAISAD
ncbi:TPA: ferredoxin [Streptococcus suis]|uniref:Ferredoxin n=3 Tax=Streptococcus suis TaxID=1307 RepID=A0A0H3MUB4_STRS4|nr:ferredoxin [Streptococcus suis]AER16941.1 ferredoxin [Streptococcus suis D9]AFR00574.1 ferredoxin [Streptococcus suis S735]AKG40558.1 ferredoxin [Streptococcus suis]ARL70984.1 ferredoxin [Streptococcus suis]ARX90549.1 ferredoxin [Streptococcus suis]